MARNDTQGNCETGFTEIHRQRLAASREYGQSDDWWAAAGDYPACGCFIFSPSGAQCVSIETLPLRLRVLFCRKRENEQPCNRQGCGFLFFDRFFFNQTSNILGGLGVLFLFVFISFTLCLSKTSERRRNKEKPNFNSNKRNESAQDVESEKSTWTSGRWISDLIKDDQ